MYLTEHADDPDYNWNIWPTKYPYGNGEVIPDSLFQPDPLYAEGWPSKDLRGAELGGWFDDFVQALTTFRRSVVNIEGDCAAGELALEQLATTYESLGRPPRYEASVKAIAHGYEYVIKQGKREKVFSLACGQIYALGQQADALRAQMLSERDLATGGGATTGPSGESHWFLWTLAIVGTAAIVGGGAYAYRHRHQLRMSGALARRRRGRR